MRAATAWEECYCRNSSLAKCAPWHTRAGPCRYAQIEKEALATTWALEHWADLLVGLTFRVENDHKPLSPLSTALHQTDRWTATSHPKFPNEAYAIRFLYWPCARKIHVYCWCPVPCPDRSRSVREWRTSVWSRVLHECGHGLASCIWPQTGRNPYWAKEGRHSQSSNAAHTAWVARWQEEAIRPNSQVLGRKRKPLGTWWPYVEGATTCLRKDILRYLHNGHQGITRTRESAASSVRCPGISRDIERMVREGPMCEKYCKERIEPMRGTEFPDRPWSWVGADFLQLKGKIYLLVVDYYSRDVEISTVSKHVNTINLLTLFLRRREFSADMESQTSCSQIMAPSLNQMIFTTSQLTEDSSTSLHPQNIRNPKTK